MNNVGWYHDSEYDGTRIFYWSIVDEHPNDSYGPFKTFIDAKKDAIAYHKSTIEVARSNIQSIRQISKNECKRYE